MMGSCPITRRDGTVNFTAADPELMLLAKTDLTLSAELERAISPCLDSGGRYWVAYDGMPGDPRDFRRWHESFVSLLRYVVAGGVVELSVPDGTLSPERVVAAYNALCKQFHHPGLAERREFHGSMAGSAINLAWSATFESRNR